MLNKPGAPQVVAWDVKSQRWCFFSLRARLVFAAENHSDQHLLIVPGHCSAPALPLPRKSLTTLHAVSMTACPYFDDSCNIGYSIILLLLWKCHLTIQWSNRSGRDCCSIWLAQVGWQNDFSRLPIRSACISSFLTIGSVLVLQAASVSLISCQGRWWLGLYVTKFYY